MKSKSPSAIEVERNDLQAALEETEGAIEAEESKVLRLQVELGQIKQNDNQRRNSQRAMESMQTTLDQGIRARAEVSRTRKKGMVLKKALNLHLKVIWSAEFRAWRTLMSIFRPCLSEFL